MDIGGEGENERRGSVGGKRYLVGTARRSLYWGGHKKTIDAQGGEI